MLKEIKKMVDQIKDYVTNNESNPKVKKAKMYKSPKLFKIIQNVRQVEIDLTGLDARKKKAECLIKVNVPVMNCYLTATVTYNSKKRLIVTKCEIGNWFYDARSTCHPDDDFNFEKGLRLSIARLVKGILACQRSEDLKTIKTLTAKCSRYKDAMNGLNTKYHLLSSKDHTAKKETKPEPEVKEALEAVNHAEF